MILNILRKNINKITFPVKRCLAMEVKPEKLLVQDQKINYLKVGEGPRTVLCLPGVLGNMWTDFPNQIQHINKSELTLICMDMPGCGESRPPERTFPPDFYQKDADIASNLMNKLGINRYSVMGWSDGGISGLILASKNPENVISIVVWGANSYVSPTDIKLYEGITDIDKWSPKMLEPFIKVYGRDGLKKGMKEWYDTLAKIEKEGGDLCKNLLSSIKAPTLIIHGDKDPLVPLEHPLCLKEHIPNSKLIRFPEGKHNLHLRYYREFNDTVEKFFKEN